MKEKISKLPAKGDNSRREEIKSELVEIRDKQAELKKSRKAVYEQLDALNDSIRKKVYKEENCFIIIISNFLLLRSLLLEAFKVKFLTRVLKK